MADTRILIGEYIIDWDDSLHTLGTGITSVWDTLPLRWKLWALGVPTEGVESIELNRSGNLWSIKTYGSGT